MPLYTQESLDQLRTKIDLVDLLSSHIQLKRSGSTYKALCPFHEEKTPSFHVQAGDDAYHCFGCGAHGDAIAFLMNHLKMNFVDAVEYLADRFGVALEKAEDGGGLRQKIDKKGLKDALECACRLYHALLLHTEAGHAALHYLYGRGITLEFIQYFRIGYAPSDRSALLTFAKGEGISEELLLESGLLTEKKRDFFSDRITFPITDPHGAVIGFSARKFKEETFGGKYINTPETPLFKKSHTLFGLSYSRQRIAKERRALIVEGQLDALQLIHNGLDIAVAGQGTAFGEGHLKILSDLGVTKVFLALDSDNAGKTATVKIGNLFQKKGIGVAVVKLPPNSDPDSYVRSSGIEAFKALMEKAEEYLMFLVDYMSIGLDLNNPAQKNELIRKITDQIRSWDEPVMVHESLRTIAKLTKVPESILGVGATPIAGIKRFGTIGKESIDPDRVLETDLLRWILLKKDPRLYEIAKLNIAEDLFQNPLCKKMYRSIIQKQEPTDLIGLGSILENEEEQKLLGEIIHKKVNLQKAEEGVIEVVHRLLIRRWMEEREAIKNKIQSGTCSESEVLQLAKAFDAIKKNQPTVVLP